MLKFNNNYRIIRLRIADYIILKELNNCLITLSSLTIPRRVDYELPPPSISPPSRGGGRLKGGWRVFFNPQFIIRNS